MGKSRRTTTFPIVPGRRRSRRYLLEGLECRCLLSASPTTLNAINVAAPAINTSSVSYTATVSNVAGSGIFAVAGYTPAQIVHAYGFGSVTAALGAQGGDGTGQTIAIVEAHNDPNIAADVKVFDQQFNLPDLVSFTQVNQNGGANLPSADDVWSRETSLDVEWAHAIAPGAKIVLVEANSDQLGDLLAAVDTARHLDGVSVVSMSWGVNEFADETAFDYVFTTPANHQPVTFLASAGDNPSPNQLQWPATSGNVVSVGGSSLTLANSGEIAMESPWLGGTVGLSNFESTPDYQNTPSRAVPDVVYNANPTPGFAVYDSGMGGWESIGGTSAGAPQWAALIAIANQARANQGQPTLDGPTQTLPQLYDFYRQVNVANTATATVLGHASFDDQQTGGGLLTLSGQGQASTLVFYGLTIGTPSGSFTTGAQPQAPVNPTDPRLKGKRAVPYVVINVQPTPTQVLSAAGFGVSHKDQSAIVASRTALTGAVTSDLGLDDTPSIPAVGTSLYAAAFSASIAPVTRGSALGQSFTGLFTTASQLFGETEVVPVGADPLSSQRAPATYYIAHLNVTATFCDAVASFINECAARPQTVATIDEPCRGHTRAWIITGAVMAIDGLILHHLAMRRRGKVKSHLRDRDDELSEAIEQ